MEKFLAFLFIASTLFATADEGMWIPMLIKKYNEKDMQSKGMRISAEDIYDINNASLKDAIVIFGGGCTGEIVSDQGLLFTNHHCGYSQIQSHSSLEFNYLEKGFWAKNQKEELSNKGLTVTLLQRMEEVTDQVLEGVSDEMSSAKREEVISENIKKIVKNATEGTHYTATVKPFYYGNQYFLYVNEIFKDIRLVGAPPSSIGKFGGDTDNWMWPRHTGDFTLFRIYTGPDGKPAEYAEDNIPYKPKKHIPISIKGYEKDDFTFVFGYPGRTQQFLTSHAVRMKVEHENPIAINLRTERLNIIKRYMAQDEGTAIQYAAKSASIANGWKKWIGENNGLKRLNTIENKIKLEEEFQNWADSNDELKAKYGGLITAFKETYEALSPYQLSYQYYIESAYSIEAFRYALGFRRLAHYANNKESREEDVKQIADDLKKGAEGFFKNYQIEIDREIFQFLIKSFDTQTLVERPKALKNFTAKYKGNYEKACNDLYNKSIFASKEKMIPFLENFSKKSNKKLQNDPIYKLSVDLVNYYIDEIILAMSIHENSLDSLYRIYNKALMEMQTEKTFYPDANSTLRVTYGKVDTYFPKDGIKYDHFTTLDGVMEKENLGLDDYKVDPKLKELWRSKDYGQYADKDGTMHVCFAASNHTTGGNSGSPVLNADGHLIGINFDRNWEGTMSDVQYDPEMCRNISVDIRYCLFVIDKLAGAKHLIDEMTIIK